MTKRIQPLRIGMVGCGSIAPAYFQGCRLFPNIQIVACADLDRAKADACAAEFGVRACSVRELLNADDIDIVLNLTVPRAHAEVSLAALQAGKHVYSEKPLATTRREARKLVAAAARKQRRIGCAPDTFFGAGVQTARRFLDDGELGDVVAVVACMMSHGPESWHPNPAFFYEEGGGPLFDMGPYYLTALVTLLGPVRRVTGSARISFPTRTITSEPLRGTVVEVKVPTHYAAVLDFESGAVGTLLMSFDVWSHSLPRIEIYGSRGTLQVPDPNRFDGVVRWRRAGETEWEELASQHRSDLARGVGVADLARAIQTGRPHRASDQLAFHVLDIMIAVGEASERGTHQTLSTRCERPAALPTGLDLGELD